MLKIETAKEMKSLVRNLRRELKLQGVLLSPELVQDALAKAVGFRDFEALQAHSLTTPSPAKDALAPSRYPLSNVGQFDLATSGELRVGEGFQDVPAAVEDIPGCSVYLGGAKRKKSGALGLTFQDTTEVNWDNQVPAKDARGVKLFQTDVGVLPADRLVLVPEFDSGALLRAAIGDKKTKVLPVRTALVSEYLNWFSGSQVLPADLEDFPAVQAACAVAAETIGFQMTAREVCEFIGWSLKAPGH